jgi:hypothetical protein
VLEVREVLHLWLAGDPCGRTAGRLGPQDRPPRRRRRGRAGLGPQRRHRAAERRVSRPGGWPQGDGARNGLPRSVGSPSDGRPRMTRATRPNPGRLCPQASDRRMTTASRMRPTTCSWGALLPGVRTAGGNRARSPRRTSVRLGSLSRWVEPNGALAQGSGRSITGVASGRAGVGLPLLRAESRGPPSAEITRRSSGARSRQPLAEATTRSEIMPK